MAKALNDSSRAILQAIADGHSYDQILAKGLAKSYLEIFQAAADAIGASSQGGYLKAEDYAVKQLAKIREKYPKAYEKWTAEEEEVLSQLFKSGKGMAEIGHEMHRKAGGIRARLIKLGLIVPGVYVPESDDSSVSK